MLLSLEHMLAPEPQRRRLESQCASLAPQTLSALSPHGWRHVQSHSLPACDTSCLRMVQRHLDTGMFCLPVKGASDWPAIATSLFAGLAPCVLQHLLILRSRAVQCVRLQQVFTRIAGQPAGSGTFMLSYTPEGSFLKCRLWEAAVHVGLLSANFSSPAK